jgi:hypothetical protein
MPRLRFAPLGEGDFIPKSTIFFAQVDCFQNQFLRKVKKATGSRDDSERQSELI